jgi:hypothetical protein
MFTKVGLVTDSMSVVSELKVRDNKERLKVTYELSCPLKILARVTGCN